MSETSKRQQQFMDRVNQYKNGELGTDEVSPEVVKAANAMKDVPTDSDGLPIQKAESLDIERFKLIIRKEVIQNLKDGNYNKNLLKEVFSIGRTSTNEAYKFDKEKYPTKGGVVASRQKFKIGDKVYAAWAGDIMKGKLVGLNREKTEFTVFIKGRGEVSWFAPTRLRPWIND